MIPRITRILYATDLSKNSAYAAYFALDLAHTHKAQIVIFHCTEAVPTTVYAAGFTEMAMDIQNRNQESAEVEIKKRLGEFYRKIGSLMTPEYARLVSDTIVKTGYPVEEILNTAEAEQCDLIVLGSHSKGWLKQTFLGSTARSVLERTRMPVFIVPLPSDSSSIDRDVV
jgi:nucleotide-binding universal stress UspA family protein